MTTSPHEALMAEQLRAELGVEPAWSEPLADGFVWWPSEYSQRFSFSSIDAGEGGVWLRSAVETEWLRTTPNVHSSTAELMSDMFNFRPIGGSAFADDKKVRLCASLITETRAKSHAAPWLAEAATLQALVVWRNLQPRTPSSKVGTKNFEPDRSDHPLRGTRSELAAGYRHRFARLTATTEPETRPLVDLDAIARHLADAGIQGVTGGTRDGWLGTSEASARSATTPSGDGPTDSPLPFQAVTRLDLGVSHPVVGDSLIVRCVIPAPREMSDRSCHAWAQRFNDAERSSFIGPSLRLGAWTFQPDPHQWVHSSAHPLATLDRALPPALAIAAVERGRWWLYTLGPDFGRETPGA